MGVLLFEMGLEKWIVVETAINQENQSSSREQLFEVEQVLKRKAVRDDEDSAGRDVRLPMQFELVSLAGHIPEMWCLFAGFRPV